MSFLPHASRPGSGAIGDPRRHSKRKLCGGLSAGVTFIFPGAVVIVVPSWARVHYGKIPQVMNALTRPRRTAATLLLCRLTDSVFDEISLDCTLSFRKDVENMNLILKRSVVVAFSVVLACAAPGLAHARSRGSDPGGHTNRGVRYARHKQYDKAIAEFTKAIKAQPNDTKNYENRAMAYRLGGKPAQALGDLSKIIEMRPKDADAYAAKGQIEVEQKKFAPAIQDLTKAIELDPKNKSAQRYRAYAYLSKKDWNKAIEDYSKVIKRSPDDIGAYERRAYAYRSLGKNNEAIADLTKVIQARPKDAETYRQRGLTYRLTKDTAKRPMIFARFSN